MVNFLSPDTLLLVLYVIAAITALYVAFRAYQLKKVWGIPFLLGPVAFVVLTHYTGMLIAGLVVLLAQIYFLTHPEGRKVVRVYLFTIVCWAGATYIRSSETGWIPASWLTAPKVEQAGTAAPAPTATEALLPVKGGRIWYRRSGVETGTPVILIHGGPGAASFYLKPLEALGDERPVVRYDQLGSGHSDAVSDNSLFTMARYVAELDSLRSALGYDKVHIVGHSWGTMLGYQYYRAHPEHVASLTLASPVISSADWGRHAVALVKTLSDSSRTAIRVREATRDYDAPDYQNAVNEFYGKYVVLHPDQEDWDSTTKTFGMNAYTYMWGPSEFTVTGTLRSYDVTRELRRIKVPVLYTVGQYDEAGPDLVARYAKLTPGSRLEVIPDAAHLTTWDNPDVMLRVLREFLHRADSSVAR